jgi:hypothetical protein
MAKTRARSARHSVERRFKKATTRWPADEHFEGEDARAGESSRSFAGSSGCVTAVENDGVALRVMESREVADP